MSPDCPHYHEWHDARISISKPAIEQFDQRRD